MFLFQYFYFINLNIVRSADTTIINISNKKESIQVILQLLKNPVEFRTPSAFEGKNPLYVLVGKGVRGLRCNKQVSNPAQLTPCVVRLTMKLLAGGTAFKPSVGSLPSVHLY